jgi:hypothetical protein
MIRAEPRVTRNKESVQNFARGTCKEETTWEIKRGKADIKTNIKGRGCVVAAAARGCRLNSAARFFEHLCVPQLE